MRRWRQLGWGHRFITLVCNDMRSGCMDLRQRQPLKRCDFQVLIGRPDRCNTDLDILSPPQLRFQTLSKFPTPDVPPPIKVLITPTSFIPFSSPTFFQLSFAWYSARSSHSTFSVSANRLSLGIIRPGPSRWRPLAAICVRCEIFLVGLRCERGGAVGVDLLT